MFSILIVIVQKTCLKFKKIWLSSSQNIDRLSKQRRKPFIIWIMFLVWIFQVRIDHSFYKEWGNFGFVPCQFLKLACQFCFSNNGQAAYNSEFILTLGFNSILWSFYNSQWLKKETYTKFCKKWLKRNIAKNGSHDIVKL